MRLRVVPPAALAGVLAALSSPAAFAGGCVHHCGGVVEGAVVRPAYNEVVHEPAVVGTRVQRIETQPGYWTASQVPAQHGFYQKSVVVRPSSVSYQTVPAQYRTVLETVVVRPERVGYEIVDLPTYLRETGARPQPFADRAELERARSETHVAKARAAQIRKARRAATARDRDEHARPREAAELPPVPPKI